MVDDCGSVTAGIIAPISPLSVRQPAESSRLWRTDMAGARGGFFGGGGKKYGGGASSGQRRGPFPGGVLPPPGRSAPPPQTSGAPSLAPHTTRGGSIYS